MNFDAHNQEVKALMKAYGEGKAYRVPVTVGISSRFAIQSPFLNPEKYTMKDYCQNPEVMFKMQLRLAEFKQFHVDADHEMGVPENGWGVAVDFQNYYEAAWFGCKIDFPENGMPTSHPFLMDDNKNQLFEKGIPDPFSGIMGTAKEFVEKFQKMSDGYEFHGAPVTYIVNGAGLWTDGPFTMACELRGLDNFCADIFEDPDYAEQLLTYLTDSIIAKMKAWRKYHGMPEKVNDFCFADDAIAMLSVDMVKDLLIPHYKRMIRELCTDDCILGIHLCGDAGRLFPMLQRELNVEWFDTGFPLDHKKLAIELDNKAFFQGGPHVALLLNGTPEQVEAETKRILEDVMPITRKFMLRDANDIAPGTPMENIKAMVDACRKYGVYR